MNERFFTENNFNEGFTKNMLNATGLYESLVKNELKEFSLRKFDFYFISNKRENIKSLADFLTSTYGYFIGEIKKEENLWEFNAETIEFPVDRETLLYWTVDLYIKGYEFDCKLDGFGSFDEKTEPAFPILNKNKIDEYFNQAMNDFEKRNYSSAITNWTKALKINPNDPNSYYSRAIAKQELNIGKAALADYDKSIEIAPTFIDAIVNRGVLKDEQGHYDSAIEDYNKAIEIDNICAKAYFNRGNSKFNKGDKNGACSDWEKAKELGADYSQERIDEECN